MSEEIKKQSCGPGCGCEIEDDSFGDPVDLSFARIITEQATALSLEKQLNLDIRMGGEEVWCLSRQLPDKNFCIAVQIGAWECSDPKLTETSEPILYFIPLVCRVSDGAMVVTNPRDHEQESIEYFVSALNLLSETHQRDLITLALYHAWSRAEEFRKEDIPN